MKRNAKVDRNQKKIVAVLRRVGATIVHTHQIKNAFDILVGFREKLFAIEIKDPSDYPKYWHGLSDDEKRRYIIVNKLTDGEKQCRTNFKCVGVPYHIVWDIDTAIEAIGANKNFFGK